jgi:diguanylate cyclase (GGDEF)-like protein
MDLVHPDDLEKTVEEAEKLMRGTDCIHFENRCRRSDGSWCWVSWSSPSPGRSPQHLYASGRDITEQRMARVNLERRASFDPLTRLPNREYLRNRLARGLANAGDAEASVCALFVDLDGFKRVNDAFGHDAGDRLLRQVAERLREVMRSGDIAARWGGDEFALFTADGGIEGAIRLAERIQTRLSDCYLHEGSQVSLSASIGIAMYTNDGESVQGLIARADAAMYASKQAGGNRYTLSENVSTIDRQAPTDPANEPTPATPV